MSGLDAASIRAKLLQAQQLSQTQNIKLKPEKEVYDSNIKVDFTILPVLNENEFTVDFLYQDSRVLTCFRELTWPETLEIDNECYTEEYKVSFHNDEKMMRLTLGKAIQWIVEFPNPEIKYAKNINILDNVSRDLGLILWQQYTNVTAFSAEQASALMAASSSYFKNDGQENTRIPPLVILVDMMAQGVVSYGEKEFMNMSSSKMEKIKLILAARMEALYSQKRSEPAIEQSEQAIAKTEAEKMIEKLRASQQQQPRR